LLSLPLIKEPAGVTTPLAWLSAVRVNEPVAGMPWQNDVTTLHMPIAIISWVPSTDEVPAEIDSSPELLLIKSLLEQKYL
jgi:hypothetical protein